MSKASAHRQHQLAVDDDSDMGPRLKFYSRVADVHFWTDRWKNSGDVSYVREETGHLPHQLRSIFTRWVPPGAAVLEAGCGLGHFTVAAWRRGCRAEGVDWSGATIAMLRERFPAIPWHVGDVRRLSFRSESFDALYSPGVCEHFEEGPTEVLDEARRVLRTGGIAIVMTPHFNDWLQRNADRLPMATAASADAEFYQYAFTRDGMAALLDRIGFDVLQIRPYDTLATMMEHAGWRVPGRIVAPLALALDYLPAVHRWGRMCLWVARKR